jgi:hypothetical protein
MLGVPYQWRSLTGDTENSSLLHSVIKKCDVIMPWAVGRYNSQSYGNTAGGVLVPDMNWCKTNNIDYIPHNQIPREKGDFLWKQVAGAKQAGVKSLYIAMFDEIDEGTAIFKTAKESRLPLNGTGRFVGIENDLQSDYYLWLTGQATKWFHGDQSLTIVKPIRP